MRVSWIDEKLCSFERRVLLHGIILPHYSLLQPERRQSWCWFHLVRNCVYQIFHAEQDQWYVQYKFWHCCIEWICCARRVFTMMPYHIKPSFFFSFRHCGQAMNSWAKFQELCAYFWIVVVTKFGNLSYILSWYPLVTCLSEKILWMSRRHRDVCVICVCPILEDREQRFLIMLLVAGLFRTGFSLIYESYCARRRGLRMLE
jgi:hypothetical protein